MLPKGLTQEAYALAFLREFGLKNLNQSLLYTLPQVKLPLQISKALFLDKPSGQLKADKYGRGPYMRLLAQTIRNPYEIWQTVAERYGKPITVLRFIRLFRGEGRDIGGFGVFNLFQGRMWSGATVFPPNHDKGKGAILNYIENQRNGALVWREK